MSEKGLVLVTGASGFVGKWTVIEALKAGYAVRGTVRSAAKGEAVKATLARQVGDEELARFSLVQCDLMSDAGWSEAMRGAMAVIHVAAQILGHEPKDHSLVVGPALEGTQRVMRFALAAGIKRVILTSSIATVGYGHGHTKGKRVYTEEHFTNLEAMRYTWAYCVGKTKAERFAWEFARENGMELTTVHPGAIIGPALDDDSSISLGLVSGLIEGTTPALPSNGFSLIDVRDVAALHIAALEKPETIGQRYLATSDYMPFPRIAEVLREAYPDLEITNKIVPDWIIKLLAFFGGPSRQIINDIGNEKHFDGSKGEKLLGRKYVSGRDAIIATAESLKRLGLLKERKKGAA